MTMPPADEGIGLARVFISYTHDTADHSARVLNLSNALRGIGFDCDIDQYHANERWPKWMEDRIEWADFVLVICTETYLRRWQGDEITGVGLGAQWESLLTRQSLYQSPERNDKFVPVAFDDADIQFIPKPLSDVTRVVLGRKLENLDRLRARLLNLPPVQMPPIRISLAPIALADGFFSQRGDTGNVGLHDEPEDITSNLFPVVFPDRIHFAKIKVKRGGSKFEERLVSVRKNLGLPGTPPTDYLIERGFLYTFRNLNEPLWAELIKTKTLIEPGEFPSAQWAASEVMGDRNKFIKLLNRCLAHLCDNNETPHEITYSEKMRCHLFAADTGQREGKLRTLALKSFATRTVYKAILDKKSTDREAIQHWQHEALRHRFLRFADQWYLVLTPFWAFTGDGKVSPSRWQKKSSSNMRKPERNRAVLGHVAFWASILCREPDLLDASVRFRIQRPLTLSISPSIIDADWMTVAKQEEQDELKTDMDTLL